MPIFDGERLCRALDCSIAFFYALIIRLDYEPPKSSTTSSFASSESYESSEMFVLLVFYITKEALLPSVIYLDSFEFNASWLVDFLLEGTFFFLSTVVIATVGGVLKLLEGLLLAPSVFLKLEPAEKELSKESLDREWCVFFF